MAIGVVRFTKKERCKLVFVMVGCLLAQSTLGTIITSWSIYICVVVSPTLYSEKSEISFVFTVTGMYGTHVLFHNLIGIKICLKCYKQAHKKSTRGILFVWTLAGFNTIINILILAALAVRISKHIVRSMRHSMQKGMQSYLLDVYWKTTIDVLQTKMKCCGITSYKDWHNIAWLDEYNVNIDNDVIKGLRTSKDKLHLPITPWSCCRTDFPMQCFHDPLQQIESTHIWAEQPSTVVDSIYSQGCIVLLRQPIEAALIAFIIIIIIILLFQITTILLSRLLYTSCRNAVILNDPEEAVPGWIFGRGDCGWSRGPGLDELAEGILRGRSMSSNSKTAGQSSKTLTVPRLKLSTKSAESTPRSDEEPVSSCDEKALMLQ